MPSSRFALYALLLAAVLPLSHGQAQDVRSRLKGLVYEAEDWCEPKSAWEKDKRSENKWCLWTTEGPGKRSGDQSLVSPKVEKDRATPEEGAPPLHMRVTGIPAGSHVAYLGNTTRPMAVSFDGKQWEKSPAGGEVCLGVFDIKDGAFDLWADDRYANPSNIGSCYFDYVRLEPAQPMQFQDYAAFTLPDGRTQLSWRTSLPCRCVVEYGQEGRFDRTVEAGQEPARNHRVVLPDVVPGQTWQARVRISFLNRVSGDFPPIEFVAGRRPAPAPSRPATLRLHVAEPTPAPRRRWPVTSGVPFPQGTLAAAADAVLKDANGAVLPAQFEAASLWPDGSVKWLTVSFLTDTDPAAPAPLSLQVSRAAPAAASDLRLDEGPDALILANAKLRLRIARKAFALFDDVRLDLNGDGAFSDAEVATGAPELGNARLITGDGAVYGLGDPDRITVEERGPVRCVVRVEGDFAAQERRLFRYRLRITLWSQQPFVGVNVAIGNNNVSQPLTPLRGAGLRIPLAGGPLRGAIHGLPLADVAGPDDLWLVQDYDNAFACSVKGQARKGERSLGIAQAENERVCVAAFVKDFWQTWPKGLAVMPDGLHVRLLPPLPKDQYTSAEDAKNFISLYYWCRDGLYQFRAGLEYTADVFVRFDAPGAAPPAAELAGHLQNPLFAAAEPKAYCDSGAFGPVDPQVKGEFDDYAAMVERSFEGVEETRRKQREYGWMNFGDWYGERRYNWGNSEYDLAWCMALQFARTADLKYLRRGDEMTRHYTTIDTIHYPVESTAPGIVYTHCAGHVGGFFDKLDARFKPDEWKHWYGQAFLQGAIDPGGHIYQPGNFVYGFLMGDRRFLEVAERVVSQQSAYFTRNFNFSIERAAGWPLINAVTAYRETGNPFHLNAARIYLEKILEKQDPETGGWRMPQGHGECECPDAGKETHMGGKAFAVGILMYGLVLYDQTCPSPEVKKSIIGGADWLMNHSWNKQRRGFRYKTGCAKYLNEGSVGGTGSLVADGIAYAHELTKDPKYKDFLLSWLSAVMTGAAKNGKSYAQLTRQTALALHYVRKWGITELPRPAEPPSKPNP